MIGLISHLANGLQGALSVPGDKSISHRALILGGLSVGETRIQGLLEGEDVLATAEALRAMGVGITVDENGDWSVVGCGIQGLSEPSCVLDMGNSGTGARLLMGVLAMHPFSCTMSGDASLNSRPMNRVIEPLSLMGVRFQPRSGGRLPLSMTGTTEILPIEYELPVASAQVKSAVLLAGLGAPGVTKIIEPKPSRDHTERMLRHFGAVVHVRESEGGGRAIDLEGCPELTAQSVDVPGDISSAAFPLVAALLVQGSSLTVSGVGLNPLRTGVIQTLKEMGARIEIVNPRVQAGEDVADLAVQTSDLKGIDVPAVRAPSMIDEYPVLAVAAAFAKGTTRLNGLAELRVKESDRLSGIARGLKACGVDVAEGDDYLIIHGEGRPPWGGAKIVTELDHRMAMSFLVMGMASEEPVVVDDARPMETSFPGFADLMNAAGARIKEQNDE